MSPPAHPPRLRIVLALLAFAQLIFSLDINIVVVALPEIGAALGFSEQTLQWVIGAYAVFAGGFLLLGGRAADLVGRRRVFVAALALYGASSFVGGLAGDAAVIVAARAVQGIGAALLLPSTLALIGTLFAEGRARNRALAVWGGAGASGLTLGALLGGVLTEAFGWSAVFFVNVPLAAVVIAGAIVFIPPDEPRAEHRSFDLSGAVTATAGATLLVFALVQGPESGWASATVAGAFVAAAVLLTAFVAIEWRAADPLLPLRLLRHRSLVVAMAVTATFMGTFGALPYFLTVQFQDVAGLSALQTGLAFLVPSLAIATGTQVGERIASRHGVRQATLLGFGIGAAGTALLARGFGADAAYVEAVPGLLVMGLGQGIAWTAMWIAAATGVEERERGIASGMASTTLNSGNAVGLAALIAVANAERDGAPTEALGHAVADGGRNAVLLAALAILAGSLLAFALPRARPAPREAIA